MNIIPAGILIMLLGSVIISFVCYGYFQLSYNVIVNYHYNNKFNFPRTKLNSVLPLESTLKKIDSSILTREFTGIHFKCLFNILLCIFGILVSLLVDGSQDNIIIWTLKIKIIWLFW